MQSDFLLSLFSFLLFCQAEAEQKVAIMGERVKIAEEQAHSLTKKKLETEEEIRRVRASAVRVCVYLHIAHGCVFGCKVLKYSFCSRCTLAEKVLA